MPKGETDLHGRVVAAIEIVVAGERTGIER
jgi:hypothetical protein